MSHRYRSRSGTRVLRLHKGLPQVHGPRVPVEAKELAVEEVWGFVHPELCVSVPLRSSSCYCRVADRVRGAVVASSSRAPLYGKGPPW